MTPGTGKSFIGAQIVFAMYKAGLRILVLSYTNHATDQFAEDCLDAGIPPSCMVRIGSKAKCSDRTASLVLSARTGEYRRRRLEWDIINALEGEAGELSSRLGDVLEGLLTSQPKWEDIEEYLEFTEGGLRFLDALRVPAGHLDNGGWAQAGRKGRPVTPDYLYQRWIGGKGPAQFADRVLAGEASTVWKMTQEERQEHHSRWLRDLTEERLEEAKMLSQQYNEVQRKIDLHKSEPEAQVVRAKQIVCCTTTGAAKYDRLVRAAKPDVVLVEEAGEILESHVLTALTSSSVKQLILIGDHKQLRPKINNYALSVEKGDGFDLNRSLFERLILQGAQHATLQTQHRMPPEISYFARNLTYPELLDGPKTAGRPGILGLRDRVVFVSHNRSEDSDVLLQDRWDPTGKGSKRNRFEAEMVVSCVKYLSQQGYPPDHIVVLTPYLGQLRLLRDLLAKNKHDPALSEFDKAELIRAGLISEASAKLDSKPLRISTIGLFPPSSPRYLT